MTSLTRVLLGSPLFTTSSPSKMCIRDSPRADRFSKMRFYRNFRGWYKACRDIHAEGRCEMCIRDRCLNSSHLFGRACVRKRGKTSWEEWQANTLAAELLMPTFLVNALSLIHIYGRKWPMQLPHRGVQKRSQCSMELSAEEKEKSP